MCCGRSKISYISVQRVIQSEHEQTAIIMLVILAFFISSVICSIDARRYPPPPDYYYDHYDGHYDDYYDSYYDSRPSRPSSSGIQPPLRPSGLRNDVDMIKEANKYADKTKTLAEIIDEMDGSREHKLFDELIGGKHIE